MVQLLHGLLAAATCAAVEVLDPFADLLRWLRDDCGGMVAPDMIRASAGTRGVITRTEIAAHTVIALIPQSCILVSDPDGADTDEHTLMALRIMEGRAETTHRFYPYFATFPTDLSHFPIHWNSSQLSLLPPRGRTAVANVLHSWREDWERFLQRAPHGRTVGKRFSFEDFKAARTLVTSRIFEVVVNGSYTLAMVPFGDLLNHAWNPAVNTEWSWFQAAQAVRSPAAGSAHDPEGWHFTLRTSAVVAAGGELHTSYGSRTQQTLLVDYGFTLPCGRSIGLETSAGERCVDELAYTLHNGASATLRRPLFGATFAQAIAVSAMRKAVRQARGITRSRSSSMPSPQSVRELMQRVLASRPVGPVEARKRLARAELGSPEFNALNLHVGELSVAEAWIDASLEAETGAQHPTPALASSHPGSVRSGGGILRAAARLHDRIHRHDPRV